MVSSAISLGILFGIVAMVCYGGANFLAAGLNRKNNSVVVAFWYFLLGSIMLAVVGFLFFRVPAITPLYAIAFFLLSLLSAGSLLVFYKALRVGRVSVVVPITGSWSVIAVAVGVYFLGEGISVVQYLGIGLAILGTVLIALKFGQERRSAHGRLSAGAAYAAITLIGWGIFFTSIGILSKQFGWLWPVLITSSGSTVVLAAYAAFSGVGLSFPSKSGTTMALYVVIATVALATYSIGTSLGYVSLVGPIAASAPFIAVVLAWIFLKERIDAAQALGIAFVVAGIAAIAL